VLAELGLGRAQARHLLTSGQAGRATRVSSALLYESARVHDLVTRPFVDDEVLALVCPRVSTSAGWRAAQPAMAPIDRALLAARIAARGPLPWVIWEPIGRHLPTLQE
jgi:hypothetical protein